MKKDKAKKVKEPKATLTSRMQMGVLSDIPTPEKLQIEIQNSNE